MSLRLGALEELIPREMERLHVPGVAVGILTGDDEDVAGFGVTSVEQPLPVDADTLFQIGSTTKTVTGTAVMRLVEQGRLDLDAPVRTYLPGLRLSDEIVAVNVTLRHLLTHTAGWVGDYFDDTGWGDDALERIVERMSGLEQVTPLGTLWSYNNACFYLAGRLVEIVAGRPYHEATRELVLAPLGMTMSFFFPHEVMLHRFVVGHLVKDERAVVGNPWLVPRAAHPIGGLVSTVRDQLRYARFHLGDGIAPDGARLLSPASMALMQSPLVEASGGQFWGLTWRVYDRGGVRTVSHGGATLGQLSTFLLVPARRFAVTVLTNADRGAVLNEIVTRWALTNYLDIELPEPAPRGLTPGELAQYAGRYAGPAATSDLQVVEKNGDLVMEVVLKGGFPYRDSPPPPAPPPMRLGLLEGDRVVVLDEPMRGAQGEFLRGPDGAIAWLRLSRLRRRVG